MEDIRKRRLKGSSVIEMAYIMPVFLSLFVLIIHTVFYYHDKAVINGAASETAILAAQAEREKDRQYDPEDFFQNRTKGKLIYMTDVGVSVETDDDMVTVSASAQRAFLKLDICQRAVIAKPEKKIRQTEWIR